MAGVVLRFSGEWCAQRLLRDDVLDSLYGRAAANPRRLIDEALQVCLAIAEGGGVEALAGLAEPLMGLHPGKFRTTDAVSRGDALKQAVLLHASLAQIDGWDDLDESDAPAAEEVNKRFATEVREAVVQTRPDLAKNFSKSAALIRRGRPVRFGYLSETAVLHFSVLHPIRQAASVRDARARLWELARAKSVSAIQRAALVTWLPNEADPTVGARQRDGLRSYKREVEQEADAAELRFYAVSSVIEAKDRVLETIG